MRLGTDTGSLVNHIAAAAKQVPPVVGMGATICMWTDREAGTVVRVSPSGKQCYVQVDNAVRVDKNGMSDCQTYEYTQNQNAAIHKFNLRKDGKWHGQAGWLMIGKRMAYHDFSF